MNKSNICTFLSLCLLIVGVLLYMFFGKQSLDDKNIGMGEESIFSAMEEAYPSFPDTEAAGETAGETDEAAGVTDETAGVTQTTIAPEYISMENTLFIGDSRTVGLMEYAGIDGADFFCTVGMSVYNIHEKPVSVPGVGKLSLTELLNGKKYHTIYIMLGINELGYRFDSTVSKYSELIDFVKSRQPDAYIFVQANLHVTKKRSDRDRVINNSAINSLNTELAKLSDEKGLFYMDANYLFDDKTGSLSSDKSEDGAHLYAKYYVWWGQWIRTRTDSLIREG